jgi:hypothetical protein
MKDLHSGVRVATLLPAALYAADNTPATVDLLGFQSAEVLLAIGVGGITFSGTNKIEFVLTHSDDDSTYTPVTTADMIGVTIASGGIIKPLVAAHATASSYRYGYKGGRRYLRLLADFSGTHGTGTSAAAIVLLGDPEVAPTANQA